MKNARIKYAMSAYLENLQIEISKYANFKEWSQATVHFVTRPAAVEHALINCKKKISNCKRKEKTSKWLSILLKTVLIVSFQIGEEKL